MSLRSRAPHSELDLHGRTTQHLRPALSLLPRRVLSNHYAVDLTPGSVPGVAKLFGFASSDQRIVGDAWYLSGEFR
jgi:hypothetical protein